MYGAGIFDKTDDLKLLATGTNMWNKSPLIHGASRLRAFRPFPPRASSSSSRR